MVHLNNKITALKRFFINFYPILLTFKKRYEEFILNIVDDVVIFGCDIKKILVIYKSIKQLPPPTYITSKLHTVFFYF